MPTTLEDLENLEMTYIVFAILVLKRLLFLPGGWYSWEFLVPYFRPKSVIFQTRPLGRNYVSII